LKSESIAFKGKNGPKEGLLRHELKGERANTRLIVLIINHISKPL
jgi:hypothetical protein